jgi:hypothetical protein
MKLVEKYGTPFKFYLFTPDFKQHQLKVGLENRWRKTSMKRNISIVIAQKLSL